MDWISRAIPRRIPNVMAVAAVGQDGALATYSNAGTFISVAAPGGDFRLDDNGGGGVLGPGWNFATGKPTYLFGYGTSASAPFVSGVAALLLAQTPTLTPAALRSRIEQFATRPAGTTRSDTYGWGIAERVQLAHAAEWSAAFDDRSTHQLHERSRREDGDASTRLVRSRSRVSRPARTTSRPATTRAATRRSACPGRRFTWAGGFGAPTVLQRQWQRAGGGDSRSACRPKSSRTTTSRTRTC